MADDSNEIVLSFHDSLLRKCDVHLLDSPRWLNDKIIGFAFEYFEREQFADFTKDVSFISPDVTQFIKLSQGPDLGIFLEPLNLESKKLVFLAVNDNESCDTVGGSHWSLLVFYREKETFEHYDSGGTCNSQIAASLSDKLTSYVKAGAGTKMNFTNMDSPHQTNGHDCGLFVICNTEHLCEQLLHSNKVSLKEAVTQEAVSRKRKTLKSLIFSLSNQS
ncbi:sentrin-specific protease 8-like [Glandiceps talaboti]